MSKVWILVFGAEVGDARAFATEDAADREAAAIIAGRLAEGYWPPPECGGDEIRELLAREDLARARLEYNLAQDDAEDKIHVVECDVEGG